MSSRRAFCALIACAASPSAAQAPRRAPGFRITSSLVLIPLGVRDRQGRVPDNLTAEDFELFDNGVRQQIVQCALENEPRETVVVFDQSESMRPDLAAVNEGVREFIRQAGPGDRISVINVQDSADLGVAPTPDADQALRELGPVKAEGRTALFDGVYLALHRLLKTKPHRAAVLVVSDGGDNASRYRERELYGLAVEANAAIHSIVTAPGFPLSPESAGQAALKHLAAQTGGWHWEGRGRAEILAMVKRLQGDPRYVLAFVPSAAAGPARRHQIEVKLRRARGLRLTWRRSYLLD